MNKLIKDKIPQEDIPNDKLIKANEYFKSQSDLDNMIREAGD